eukprot:CAMPEP_0178988656 /NCGR_PEP_ID=MMETSP0795-20121207/3925_1 /TAXON_ID=88552 /ORGANISM="Amoebophrya sp., Strain Ameob2" /LENGTH=858 /DNA_ID=CAMNT_0020679941 /DNA_START=287 /DNA_END=2864 /DNA_ORIENTATION=-
MPCCCGLSSDPFKGLSGGVETTGSLSHQDELAAALEGAGHLHDQEYSHLRTTSDASAGYLVPNASRSVKLQIYFRGDKYVVELPPEWGTGAMSGSACGRFLLEKLEITEEKLSEKAKQFGFFVRETHTRLKYYEDDLPRLARDIIDHEDRVRSTLAAAGAQESAASSARPPLDNDKLFESLSFALEAAQGVKHFAAETIHLNPNRRATIFTPPLHHTEVDLLLKHVLTRSFQLYWVTRRASAPVLRYFQIASDASCLYCYLCDDVYGALEELEVVDFVGAQPALLLGQQTPGFEFHDNVLFELSDLSFSLVFRNTTRSNYTLGYYRASTTAHLLGASTRSSRLEVLDFIARNEAEFNYIVGVLKACILHSKHDQGEERVAKYQASKTVLFGEHSRRWVKAQESGELQSDFLRFLLDADEHRSVASPRISWSPRARGIVAGGGGRADEELLNPLDVLEGGETPIGESLSPRVKQRTIVQATTAVAKAGAGSGGTPAGAIACLDGRSGFVPTSEQVLAPEGVALLQRLPEKKFLERHERIRRHLQRHRKFALEIFPEHCKNLFAGCYEYEGLLRVCYETAIAETERHLEESAALRLANEKAAAAMCAYRAGLEIDNVDLLFARAWTLLRMNEMQDEVEEGCEHLHRGRLTVTGTAAAGDEQRQRGQYTGLRPAATSAKVPRLSVSIGPPRVITTMAAAMSAPCMPRFVEVDEQKFDNVQGTSRPGAAAPASSRLPGNAAGAGEAERQAVPSPLAPIEKTASRASTTSVTGGGGVHLLCAPEGRAAVKRSFLAPIHERLFLSCLRPDKLEHCGTEIYVAEGDGKGSVGPAAGDAPDRETRKSWWETMMESSSSSNSEEDYY